MFCSNCGKKLPEDARFCPDCGNMIKKTNQNLTETHSSEKFTQEKISPNQLKRGKFEEGICPQCGSSDCEIQVQQNIMGSGSNYNVGTGCLGFLLTGPFGLLCGLCGTGRKTTTSHQSVWICKKCGNQFPTRAATIDSLMTTGLTGGFLKGFAFVSLFAGIMSIISEHNFPVMIVFVVAACAMYLLGCLLVSRLIKLYGYNSVEDFLSVQEYDEYKKVVIFGGVLAVVITTLGVIIINIL